MPLKLVFIGRLEDVAGQPERQVEAAATIDQLLSALEPELADALRGERIRLAVNGSVVADRGAVSLADGDEIAFLPPVSGADMAADVRLLGASFDPAAELAAFAAGQAEAGGIASFLGQVRAGGGVEALELKHYEPLTLPGMQALAQEAQRRWPLAGLLMIHRTGVMLPGEPIVLVAAAARHRREAFAAAEYAMDHLKSESWFWKREKAGGAWNWIEPRAADYQDLKRWE